QVYLQYLSSHKRSSTSHHRRNCDQGRWIPTVCHPIANWTPYCGPTSRMIAHLQRCLRWVSNATPSNVLYVSSIPVSTNVGRPLLASKSPREPLGVIAVCLLPTATAKDRTQTYLVAGQNPATKHLRVFGRNLILPAYFLQYT